MCNLYSITRSQDAMRRLFAVDRDTTGNLPPIPGVYPDSMAPVIHTAEDGMRELTLMRWGMPGPPQFGGAPITNIRNTASPHWRRWLRPEPMPHTGQFVLRVGTNQAEEDADMVCA